MTVAELKSIISPDVYLIANAGEFIRVNLEEDAIGREIGEGQAWEGCNYLSKMIEYARELMRRRGLVDTGYVQMLEDLKESEFDRLASGIRLAPAECSKIYDATVDFVDSFA